MKKSTRALAGMVVLDALLVAGAAWMVMQVKSGAWNAYDPAATITEITRTAGGAIGIVSAVLLVGVCCASAAAGLVSSRKLPKKRSAFGDAEMATRHV